jgi:hypothetical protein
MRVERAHKGGALHPSCYTTSAAAPIRAVGTTLLRVEASIARGKREAERVPFAPAHPTALRDTPPVGGPIPPHR